jgi:hypothetical protein
MRRDALDRAIKKIHWRTPKWLYARCSECKDDVKGETMWWFRRNANAFSSGCTYKQWTCRRCAPLMSDLFKLNPKFFKDVDYSIIVEEERQLRQYNERGSTPSGGSAGPP